MLGNENASCIEVFLPLPYEWQHVFLDYGRYICMLLTLEFGKCFACHMIIVVLLITCVRTLVTEYRHLMLLILYRYMFKYIYPAPKR